jgi:serine/threonine-protein kinase
LARILVSDDDPHVLRLISLCLEEAGHDVVLTQDSGEVAALARGSAFDAIILDVMMTPLSGFEVLGELRRDAATAAIPVLFLSGRAEASDRTRGLREGADDYLTKPFEPEELELRVERLVAWRGRGGSTASQLQAASRAPYLGRYEVRDVIGQGTMGTVYRGWDPRLRRAVALKTIRLDSITTESRRREMLDRLHNEAVTVALFNHPHIVAVYDMGDAESSAFIAMELVEGVSLARFIARTGRLPAARLIPLALAVARALAAAHERQVIHRDVKPGNVLLGRDGAVKVTDFGVAFIFSQVSDESQQLYGTPGYVPPEALRQQPYTQAGDLYGLGVMLYEAAAGAHPMAGANLRETIERTLAGDVTPLAERQKGLPAELADLVMALLATEPGRRPDAAAVVELLAELTARDQLQWSAAALPEDL